MSALVIRSVTKCFDDVIAVADVSLELAEHELLALVGPSGCGKSTLLRMIAGLHPTESGLIELGGQVVDGNGAAVPPERRRVGLVFQEHALFPHLTVDDNVGFGVRDGDRIARVAEMLALVGMSEYGGRFPHELSGGERQRVALARALAPRPALLLLDEPFASLDPNLRARVRDDVAAILRSTRTPAVFVTHDQNEALAIGDRVAVMQAGRIVQIDTPERVFHAPASRFVAAFMGEASFLTAGTAPVELTGSDLPTGTTVMVRPDDVTFESATNGGARIESAEFRGSAWCYTLTLDSGGELRSTRSHLERVAVGTRVAPSLRPGHRPVPISGEATPRR